MTAVGCAPGGPAADTGAVLRCVVVLAGGGSRRLGYDKISARLGDTTVLDHLLDGLVGALPGVPLVGVGPPRATRQAVTWVREDPPGGGPVAGLARALQELAPDDGPDDGWLAVVAGDQPFAAQAVAVLAERAGRADADAVLALDDDRPQPLLGVYRVGALRAAIGNDAADRSVRSVARVLRVVEVPVPPGAARDVDTADDLAAARRAAEEADGLRE